jgi:hypothetical protein
MAQFTLTGPRGDNPLGFLIALGALLTLEDAGYRALLGWRGLSPQLLVSPDGSTEGSRIADRESLVDVLHKRLRRSPGATAEKTERASKAMDRAKTAVKKKQDEIKSRTLSRDAAREARDRELRPLQYRVDCRARIFKLRLAMSSPDPSVTLGKNLTGLNSELIAHARAASEQCSHDSRRWADLAAAYGVADPDVPDRRMLASPWALISGSGHQDFLGSVQELMIRCTVEHLRKALFGPWDPTDGKFSLRLDPGDDRRYALMDRDPTASENKPLTLWGANRLAFEALRFFPCLPVRGGMAVLGWQAASGNWQDDCRVRWPLWDEPIVAPVLGSLLGLEDIWLEESTVARERLRGLGVRAVMESRRIAIGEGANKKYNLSPAAPVWVG